jgi:hypothetical protein
MSLPDFYSNFEQLFMCRFFENEWKEISYRNEWSKAKKNAGGCTNYETCGNNPQLKLKVESNGSSVDAFFYLQTERSSKDIGIGFEIYDLKG